MKLKTYNSNSTACKIKSTKPFLTFGKNGVIRINALAAQQWALKPSDQLQFHQDEEDPVNWYVEVVKKDCFPVRTCSAGNGFLFNASQLKQLLFQSINYTGDSGRIYIGETIDHQKSKLHTLLTAKLKTK